MKKRYAQVDECRCTACGACERVCPASAIAVRAGGAAETDISLCTACGACAEVCAFGAITIGKGAPKRGACPMCAAIAATAPHTPIVPLPSRKRSC